MRVSSNEGNHFRVFPRPGDHQYCGNACGGGGSDDSNPEAGDDASVTGRAGGVRGKGKGGAAGKISLGDCGKSALTIASARVCTEDARGHFNAKTRRMDEFLSCVDEQLQLQTAVLPAPTEATRTLSALRETIAISREKCVDGWSLCNGLVESLEEALRVLEPVSRPASPSFQTPKHFLFPDKVLLNCHFFFPEKINNAEAELLDRAVR